MCSTAQNGPIKSHVLQRSGNVDVLHVMENTSAATEIFKHCRISLYAMCAVFNAPYLIRHTCNI